jgi:hypothetical protein
LASPVLLFGLELIVLKQDFFSLFLIIRCVRVRVCARAGARGRARVFARI